MSTNEVQNYEEEEVYIGKAAPDMPKQMGADFKNVNQGAVFIEGSRAIAEAQGKLVIAKQFPRDETNAYANAIRSCKRPSMAETAFYSFPKGGATVNGVSIRFAEELARCWGNIEHNTKELSRDKGKSEMQAYCWDMETNTIASQTFTNPHYREVRGKMEELRTDRDIYENNANMAARRKRAMILAILPNWLVEDCIIECKKTIAGKNDEPLADRVRKMVVAFEKYGVSIDMIEKRLKRKVSTMTSDDFVDYIGIFNAIKDKQSTVAEWFEPPKQATDITNILDSEIEGESAV